MTAPNIVFILADDLGWADLGVYGATDFKTPHLDHLASQGVRFNQAYANSAVCSATRIALITGRYQYRLRAGLEEPLARYGAQLGLPPDHPTLPSLLKKAGYDTALIGKWHLGKPPAYGPQRSGYDYFFGNHSGAIDYFTHKPGVGEQFSADLWQGDSPVERTGYYTDILGEEATRYVHERKGQDKPFFLSLHFTAPHWPWEGPNDEHVAHSIKDLFHYDGGSLKKYGEIVEALDKAVGQVLQALDDTGQADNTIVIFTSDNGGERFSKTWPFTGQKTELLEGGIRVPTLLRWTARIQPQVQEQVTATFDWLPTLLAAAGARQDPDFRAMDRTYCLSSKERPRSLTAPCSGATSLRASARYARAPGSTSRSTTTNFCSMSSTTHASAPTSRSITPKYLPCCASSGKSGTGNCYPFPLKATATVCHPTFRQTAMYRRV